MYETFFGLNCKPFQLNPDPNFYYSSRPHRRAKAYLEYGVQRNEGFIVITGEVGAGKTTIVRGLLASLDPSQVTAANLVTTQLGAEDTLRMVGSAFGVPVAGLSKSELLMALEAFLVHQTSLGKRSLLVVDEAQNLTRQSVEELRMLSNFQLNQQSLLQTFLVGQPEFRAILQSSDMQQLRQRVTATCHIGPLDLDETQGYILHRLKCAGATDRPTFDAAAYEAIFNVSGGIPRRINLVCDRLLLAGYLGKKWAFGVDDVKQVIAEFDEESSAPISSVRTSQFGSFDGDGRRKAPAPSVDIDLSKLRIAPRIAQTISSQLEAEGVEHYDARLRRLEGSLLRLEQGQVELLAHLQKLLAVASQTESGHSL